MKLRPDYLSVAGIFLLAISITFMCSSSQLIFSRGVSFVSTELSQSPGQETLAWSKTGFKTNEEIMAFPTHLGEWEGYDWDKRQSADLRETLGANVFLMRNYYRPGFSNPVFFLIVQAKESSALHPPVVCYNALGYHVEEEEDTLKLTSADQDETAASSAMSSGTIPMKKLVVFKSSGDTVTERRVVLYCYLKGGQFTRDTINLIRISAIVPVEGSYDNILAEMKGFAGLAIPQLFDEQQEGENQTLLADLAGRGPDGKALIFLAFAMPIALVTHPLWRKSHRQEGATS